MSLRELWNRYRSNWKRWDGPLSPPFQGYVDQGIRELEQYLARY